MYLKKLEFVEQSFSNGADRGFDAAIADPGTLFVGFHQSGILQYLHVVRNRRLREFDSLLNIGGCPSFWCSGFANRAGMKQAQDFASGWIGYGSKRQTQLISCSFHDGAPIIEHSGNSASSKQNQKLLARSYRCNAGRVIVC
jgi:hypothetical protein